MNTKDTEKQKFGWIALNCVKIQRTQNLHFRQLEQIIDQNITNSHLNWKFLNERKLDNAYSNIEPGNWIELYENSKGDQVINFGRKKNKIKDGLWQTLYRLNSDKEFKNIGGGLYLQGRKIGKWIEVQKQLEGQFILYSGIYGNAQRAGQWKFQIFEIQTQQLSNIGGGVYDNDTGLKIGIWVELHFNYEKEFEIIEVGEYLNGIKIGNWKTILKQKFQFKFRKIGGGFFNNKGQKIKKWIDLHDDFDSLCLVTYQGNYADGYKVGLWDAQNIKTLIACGVYGIYEKKVGMWIELYDNYYELNQLFQIGYYQSGLRSKNWTILLKTQNLQREIRIGGGTYDETEGQKIGFWVEPHLNFYEDCQIIMVGDYQMDTKIGSWEIYFRRSEHCKYQSIGEGNYNEQGVKTGNWDELEDIYDCNHQIINSGGYYEGKKHGLWEIKYRMKDEKFIIIGGGSYNYGQKTGRWHEPFKNFNYQNQVSFNGTYKNNQKQGKWDLCFKNSYEEQFQVLGGGYYDNKYGTKDGIWDEIDDMNNLKKESFFIKRKFQKGMILYPIKNQFVQ